MTILSLLFAGASLVLAIAALSPLLSAAPTLYQPFPVDVMPLLCDKGHYVVGVTTLEAAYPAKVNDIVGNEVERSLTLEVWYPAASSAQMATYINETRSGQVFEVQADASRDAPIAAADTDFPVIVISHGYTGYRTLMFYLGEHLASHGYVVAAIDHTDSTNKKGNFAENPYSGFPQ
jgi:Predicted dienelactone hydrolase